MKKCSILLMIMMLIFSTGFSAAAVYAEDEPGAAQGDFEYTETADGITITKYTGSGTEVTVPAVINGKPVKAIGDNAFYDNRTIVSVILPEGINTLGNGAFYDCDYLKSIYLPDSITSIGNKAFTDNTGLAEVKIPASVTKIGDETFKNCYQLTSVELPDGIESIGNNAFYKCMNLESINMPANLKSIGAGAFGICHKISVIELGDKVETIGKAAFSDCRGLNTVSLPDTITAIPDEAFCGCGLLTEIRMPSAYTSIGASAFNGCFNLLDVNMPDGLETIGKEAFKNCTSFKSVYLPDSVTEIGERSFSDCINMTDFTMSMNLKTVGAYAFYNCYQMKSICFSPVLETVGDEAFLETDALTDVYICDLEHYNNEIEFGEGESNPTNRSGVKTHNVYNLEELSFENLDFTCDGKEHVIVPECKKLSAEDFTYDELKVKDPGTYSMTLKAVNNKKCYGEKILTIKVSENPAFIENPIRIAGSSRYSTSRKAAGKFLAATGAKKYDNVIVAYGGNFPDALGGGYLAKEKNAPIILVDKQNETAVFNDIKANMKSDGNVYILGGTGVVSEGFEKMSGNEFGAEHVKRLAGASRYDTNLEILKECGTDFSELLVCTGSNYPDSLSASAAGRPILLVEGDKLTAAQKEYLAGVKANVNKVYAVGGEGAVSDKVITAVKNQLDGAGTERLAGKTRFETSKLVAQKFFPSSKTIVLAVADNFPDGLSGAPVAMAFDAPIVLVTNSEYKDAEAYAAGAGVKKGVVFGGTSLISDKVAKSMLN